MPPQHSEEGAGADGEPRVLALVTLGADGSRVSSARCQAAVEWLVAPQAERSVLLGSRLSSAGGTAAPPVVAVGLAVFPEEEGREVGAVALCVRRRVLLVHSRSGALKELVGLLEGSQGPPAEPGVGQACCIFACGQRGAGAAIALLRDPAVGARLTLALDLAECGAEIEMGSHKTVLHSASRRGRQWSLPDAARSVVRSQ